MKLLLNLLKAFCIVIGLDFLYCVGLRVIEATQFHVSLFDPSFPFAPSCHDFWSAFDPFHLSFFGPFLVAFFALYLPRMGRIFAATGALLLVLYTLALVSTDF